MIKPVSTRAFQKCLRELRKKGREGKKAFQQAMTAQAELANFGEIKSVHLTKHGESRIPNSRKYDLTDFYRLVVQVIDQECWAFLFVGDHEDADRWLDNHKNYKWVKNEKDRKLEFVQVSDPRESVVASPNYDVESPESLLELPMLRDVTEIEWEQSTFDEKATEYLQSITANDWEQDPNGVLNQIENVAGTESAMFALDLLTHAHNREWHSVHARMGMNSGESEVVTGEDVAAAMTSPENREQFITWDDLSTLPEDVDWADWMLFLHETQQEFVDADYNGPARLRGVSGSGKTCVMVHRARRLAREYKQQVLMVTLTDSMRRLLELLRDCLCGAEKAYIKITTVNKLAMNAIEALAADGLKSFSQANDHQVNEILKDAINAMRVADEFENTVLSKLPNSAFNRFIGDEIRFVRMRFLPSEYDEYLKVKRHGRGIPLPEKARTIILIGVRIWDAEMNRLHLKDHEGVVQHALQTLDKSSLLARTDFRYRCVLVDEVQDLSQVELRILSLLPDEYGKRAVDQANGMFLVGDGAQSIYRKGFVLKNCGISVANRSYVLQKNYRNTREILEAAFGLIASYEFADVDEDNIASPTAPDLSSRHGETPVIVKASTRDDENAFIVSTISELIQEQRDFDESDGLEVATEIPVCVIGFNSGIRQRIARALREAKIKTCELREDVGWDNDSVKISTLESAKGHEFHAVFIVGVCQGVIPHGNTEESEWGREAARLYVAMTRARDRLYLSYCSNETPSVFLAAIQDDCCELEWKRGKLKSIR